MTDPPYIFLLFAFLFQCHRLSAANQLAPSDLLDLDHISTDFTSVNFSDLLDIRHCSISLCVFFKVIFSFKSTSFPVATTAYMSKVPKGILDIRVFFFKPPKKGQCPDHKYWNNDPVVQTEYLGYGYLAEIALG
jgi:hypothetical protein